MTRPGFTLAETAALLVVISAGLLVLAPAIAPTLQPGPAMETATELARKLDMTRRRAQRSGNAASFLFDPAAARFWEYSQTPSGLELIGQGTLAPASGARWLAHGSPRVEFRFEPTGTASGDSLIAIDGGGEVQLTIDRLTGEVRLEER
jgi:hypothetical protein